MREIRLAQDYEAMMKLHQKSELINISSETKSHEYYNVVYYCRSLSWLDGNSAPSFSNRHELSIYLHKDYPRTPPNLKWLTNIFHPNILPPQKNGGVCIGFWTAAESLDQLCLRVGEMLQYKVYNLNDPLDREAAGWIKKNLTILPTDKRCLL